MADDDVTPTVEDVIADVADLLHNHLSDWIVWEATEDGGEHRVDAPVELLAERLADLIASERADAWDEGWCAGVSRFTQQTEPPKDNPYRVVGPWRAEP